MCVCWVGGGGEGVCVGGAHATFAAMPVCAEQIIVAEQINISW